jgi:hypothetical protein
MLRVDLEAAGVPYETSEGVADFHALRVAYITGLVNSGASVKTCQTLARHSTPSLTIGIYAKTALHDVAGAVEDLPDLTPKEKPTAQPLTLTGTDGPSITSHLAHHLPTGEGGPVRPETVPGVMTGSNVQESMEGKGLENKAPGGSVRLQAVPDANHRDRVTSRLHGHGMLVRVESPFRSQFPESCDG